MIVIIGTGLAGYSLAKEIRKLSPTQALTLITQDDGHFYSKPQLSTALFHEKSPEGLIITDAATLQNQLSATIYTFSSVKAIDAATQTIVIQTPQGEQHLSYSQLVLAVGAAPKPLAITENLKNHYRINSLVDYAAFMQELQNPQDIIILGSGLVGCEFAHDFMKRFPKISIVSPDPHPLYGVVPKPIGHALQQKLADLGLQWHMNVLPTKAITQDNKIILDLSTGQQISAHHMITAIGLKPNIAVAEQAQIAVNQGIVVDNYLQTNIPHIYAIGDCAEISGVCRQFVAPILQSARALAQTLSGKLTPVVFPPVPISLKVSAYPIIVYPPAAHHQGEWEFDYQDSDIKAVYKDNDGNVRGYALSGKQCEHRQTCLQSLKP